MEVRLKATNTDPHRGNHDESESYFLDVDEPISAAGILKCLREQSLIKTYIKEHDICADPTAIPEIVSSLSENVEFAIDLPSTVVGQQFIIVRIIHDEL